MFLESLKDLLKLLPFFIDLFSELRTLYSLEIYIDSTLLWNFMVKVLQSSSPPRDLEYDHPLTTLSQNYLLPTAASIQIFSSNSLTRETSININIK